MSDSKTIGKQGEQIAESYLLGLGYSISACNYRIGHLEIDIIAEKDGNLYFVEVKTRSCSLDSVDDFMPETAMTHKKKDRVIRAAEQYIAQYNRAGEVFLELIAINIADNDHQLRHYSGVQWL